MAEIAKQRTPKVRNDEFVATIYFHWEDWDALPQHRRNQLANLAAVSDVSDVDQISMMFTRDAWFALCGELYALMLIKAEFTVDTGLAVTFNVKGGERS